MQIPSIIVGVEGNATNMKSKRLACAPYQLNMQPFDLLTSALRGLTRGSGTAYSGGHIGFAVNSLVIRIGVDKQIGEHIVHRPLMARRGCQIVLAEAEQRIDFDSGQFAIH